MPIIRAWRSAALAALVAAALASPSSAHWYLDRPTTTFERAVRCIVALNLRPEARWIGDTETMTRIIARDPAVARRGAELPENNY